MSETEKAKNKHARALGKLGGRAKAARMAAGEIVAWRKPGVPRCPCGKSTLKRAKSRNFDCCREAGVDYSAALSACKTVV